METGKAGRRVGTGRGWRQVRQAGGLEQGVDGDR